MIVHIDGTYLCRQTNTIPAHDKKTEATSKALPSSYLVERQASPFF
ncbi:hypothetical protein QK289_04750 [Exiguobacterium antarcticum]|uniref:Transposase n=1 Tax=Exiguobacterium antarcticum TaxID=132920 RepID=A0ABT6R043_9BACL|nr:hypothetical protein [Exiguobacterium antarcticum]MDI3234309.1 hypothetical protein [Exiguobacterium antarcticum]